LWELVDGRGEPLNPPFNSIVTELYLEDSKASKPLNSPWLRGKINSDDLAILLGNAPPLTPVVQVHEEPLSSMVVRPNNDTSPPQDKDNIDNSVAMQFDEDKALPGPPAEGVANGESPGDLGPGLEDAQPASGSAPSAPAEPIKPIADAQSFGVTNLDTPSPNPLPDGPAKPEPPLADAGSIGAAAEQPERDRPATAFPDSAPTKDSELEALKDVLPAVGEGEDLDPTMVPSPASGLLARLGQGLRRRLGPS
jgi:hypothetical protein